MENYEMVQSLSESPSSHVMKMIRKNDNKLVVCKKIKYSGMSEKEKQHIVQEVNILSKMKSQHIIKYFEHFIDKTAFEIFIITEYCEGGDLQSFLTTTRKNLSSIPQESIWKIFMQVAMALCEIHNRKEGRIIHRDIKPANIFLDADHNVKLGDFGLAKRLNNEDNFGMTMLNDAYYLSPEQLTTGTFTEKTDIWAIGCLLYQMATLNVPFPGENQFKVAMKIKDGHISSLPSCYSRELTRVIKWCLLPNPADRPTSQDLVHVPSVERIVRSKRLAQNISILNFREKQIIKKENELDQRQKVLNEKAETYNTIKTTRMPLRELDNLL